MRNINKLLFLVLLVCASAFGENPQLIKASPPITLQNGFVGIPQADGTTNGFLSAADWIKFNNSGTPFSSTVTAPNFIMTSATPNTAAYFDGGKSLSSVTAGTNGQFLQQQAGGPVWATVNTAPTWGSITGTLSNQTDLQAALDAKANLSGATFTGNILVPSESITGDPGNFNIATVGFPYGGSLTNDPSGNFHINGAYILLDASQVIEFLGNTIYNADNTFDFGIYPNNVTLGRARDGYFARHLFLGDPGVADGKLILGGLTIPSIDVTTPYLQFTLSGVQQFYMHSEGLFFDSNKAVLADSDDAPSWIGATHPEFGPTQRKSNRFSGAYLAENVRIGEGKPSGHLTVGNVFAGGGTVTIRQGDDVPLQTSLVKTSANNVTTINFVNAGQDPEFSQYVGLGDGLELTSTAPTEGEVTVVNSESQLTVATPLGDGTLTDAALRRNILMVLDRFGNRVFQIDKDSQIRAYDNLLFYGGPSNIGDVDGHTPKHIISSGVNESGVFGSNNPVTIGFNSGFFTSREGDVISYVFNDASAGHIGFVDEVNPGLAYYQFHYRGLTEPNVVSYGSNAINLFKFDYSDTVHFYASVVNEDTGVGGFSNLNGTILLPSYTFNAQRETGFSRSIVGGFDRINVSVVGQPSFGPNYPFVGAFMQFGDGGGGLAADRYLGWYPITPGLEYAWYWDGSGTQQIRHLIGGITYGINFEPNGDLTWTNSGVDGGHGPVLGNIGDSGGTHNPLNIWAGAVGGVSGTVTIVSGSSGVPTLASTAATLNFNSSNTLTRMFLGQFGLHFPFNQDIVADGDDNSNYFGASGYARVDPAERRHRFAGAYLAENVRVGEHDNPSQGRVDIGRMNGAGGTIIAQQGDDVALNTYGTMTTDANASTTLNFTGGNAGNSYWMGIGDVIELDSTSPTEGEITVVNSDTQLTVDTALGDGTASGGTLKKSIMLLLDNAGNKVFFIDHAKHIKAYSNFYFPTVGTGLNFKTGANSRLERHTLASGTVVVANTSVTASTDIFCSNIGASGAVGSLSVAPSAGVGYTVNSTSVTDNSLVACQLVEEF